MAARPWLLLLALAGVLLQVRSLPVPDSTAFVNIDCGLPEQAGSYVDTATKLLYVPDGAFTDAGSTHNISAEYIFQSSTKRFVSVRSFPGATRSCYTIPSPAPAGSKYLIRATFVYGNYDGLNRLPLFDVYLGVNFWTTVNISIPDMPEIAEVVAVVPDEYVQVCLVDTDSGTPFISILELRPLRNTLYPQADATQALVLVGRGNFGTSDVSLVRYPEDPYDRWWFQVHSSLEDMGIEIDAQARKEIEINPQAWTGLSTPQKMQHALEMTDPRLYAPSVVMQTAIVPGNGSRTIDLLWPAVPNHANPDPKFICIVYFAELEVVAGDALRQFEMIINGKPFSTVRISHAPWWLTGVSAPRSSPWRVRAC